MRKPTCGFSPGLPPPRVTYLTENSIALCSAWIAASVPAARPPSNGGALARRPTLCISPPRIAIPAPREASEFARGDAINL